MADHALSSDDLHEVGMLQYTRGTDPMNISRWNLYQGICTNYNKGPDLFNLEGREWRGIVSVLADTYVKRDNQQDTAYWSENRSLR